MNQDLLTKYLKKLVSFKTISGLDYQNEVLKLYDWFVDSILIEGFRTRLFESNGFNSLIIEPEKARKGPAVVLLAHIDVVPAPKEMFVMTKKNGRLFGRGVSDMKFAAAIFLHLINTFPGFATKNIKIVLTSDEEIGSANGVKALIEAGELRADVVILPDGGDNFELVTEAKGFIHIEVLSTGKSAHGSSPWDGKNAIDELISGYAKLQKKFNNFSKGHWINTMNLGHVSGGIVANSIPDTASFKIDFRYTEKSSHEKIMRQINEAFGPRCNYTVLGHGNNFKLDIKNKFVKEMIALVEKTTGKPIKLIKEHGGSDGRFFTKYNIPALLVKPKAGGHHTMKEWLDIASFSVYTKMLEEYLKSI